MPRTAIDPKVPHASISVPKDAYDASKQPQKEHASAGKAMAAKAKSGKAVPSAATP